MTRPRILTFGAGLAGAALFLLLGLPLPWLLGPMLGCLIVALSGARMQGAGQFGIFMRTFLGVAVGASITPQVLGGLPAIAGSLAMVPIFIGVIALSAIRCCGSSSVSTIRPPGMRPCPAGCRTCWSLARKRAATSAPCR